MNDKHYVWCSEDFDSSTLHAYSSAFMVPPSSNPADIFRQLRQDVQKRDTHSAKINQQKVSITDRAIEWEKKGQISTADKDDIVYWVTTAAFDLWRPLIYVIPRPPVKTRLVTVPARLRSGIGIEYTIPDLDRSEFEVIEP